MKSYSASYFKMHFGAVLDHAGMEAVRIERRGRQAAVIITEAEYRQLRRKASLGNQDPDSAVSRLRSMALGTEVNLSSLKSDPRAQTILQKHS